MAAPTQKDIDTYLNYVRIIYLLCPAYFEEKFMPKHLFTIADGKITLNFTLEDCLKIYESQVRAPKQVAS